MAESDEVSQALAELREMFPSPNIAFEIAIREGFAVRSRILFFAVDSAGTPWNTKQVSADTVTECMAKVRQFKEQQ